MTKVKSQFRPWPIQIPLFAWALGGSREIKHPPPPRVKIVTCSDTWVLKVTNDNVEHTQKISIFYERTNYKFFPNINNAMSLL